MFAGTKADAGLAGGRSTSGPAVAAARLVAVFFRSCRSSLIPLTEKVARPSPATYRTRKIFSNLRPFANSSTNLSKYLTCCVNGLSISSTR